MTTLTGNQIVKFQLLVLLRGLEIEASGKRKRGRSCSAIVKKKFGWKGNPEAIHALLQAVIDHMPDTP